MSADNGVYIGRFKRVCSDRDHIGSNQCDTGYEYRVIHAQCIENCDYDDRWAAELTDAYRVNYYGRADVCYTEDEAWQQAQALYKQIVEDPDGMGILEYGICCCNYDVPFPSLTVEQADKILDDDFKQNEYVPQQESEPIALTETDRRELKEASLNLAEVAISIAKVVDQASPEALDAIYRRLDDATLRIAKAFKT